MRQIVEKNLEFNEELYLCFVDFAESWTLTTEIERKIDACEHR